MAGGLPMLWSKAATEVVKAKISMEFIQQFSSMGYWNVGPEMFSALLQKFSQKASNIK